MENFKVMRAWDSKYGYIKYIYKDNGKKQIGKVKFEWWFYIKTSDYRKRKGIFEHLINEKLINKTEQEGLYTRIYVDYNHSNDFLDIDNEMVWEYKTYKFYQVKKTLEQANIQTYEADVLPYKRWLLQNNVEIETEYKVLYYDIETDDRHGKIEIGRDRILSIALLDEQTGKEKFLYLKEFTDEAERALLKKLARILNAYDVIVGWNSNNFDDLYIKARFARYGIKIDWRRLFLIDQYKIFITDGPKLSRYNLDTVANYILNESKVEHSETIYELWKYNKKKLKEYNLQDVRLLYKIEKKTLLLKNNRFINAVGKCPVDDYFITRKIDNMLLMRVQERKHYHFKTKTKDDINHEKFKGAYVFNPIAGYYEKINVVDFSSLYPNVIKTFNISPDTYIEPIDINKYNKKDLIKCINGAYYRKDIIGIMPEVIMHVQDKRNFYKAKLKEYDKGTPEYEIYNALQYVYKKFGLSFYGAIGEIHTRFYNVKIAESVTQMGVYFNKTCSEYCKKKGFKTVYGDSVTEDRCTVIKYNGIIKIVSFKELYDMTDIKYKSRGKEFGIFIKSIKTMSYNFKERKEEWQPIIRVIKHKTNKKIYEYHGKYGNTKVTEDHSLIDKNGKEFTVKDGFNDFSIRNNKIINKNPYYKEIEYNGYVYDLEVNSNHNFIDAEHGLLLHNTDSLFLENLPINKMNSLLKNIEKLCKLHAVKKFNSNNCSLKMDYDKGFKNIIILAKKRYAGIITYLDSHILDKPLLYVAGLEYKRTDGCNYLRKIQKELIEKILLPDKLPSITEIYQYLIDKKSKLFNREVTLEDITLSQKLTKEIDEYDGRRLNVIVAKEMINDGKEIYVGNKIPYFIESINEKKQPVPKPIYKYKGNFHAIYYWNKTIYPALERILLAVYPEFEWKQLYSKNAKTNIRSNSTSLW